MFFIHEFVIVFLKLFVASCLAGMVVMSFF